MDAWVNAGNGEIRIPGDMQAIVLRMAAVQLERHAKKYRGEGEYEFRSGIREAKTVLERLAQEAKQGN